MGLLDKFGHGYPVGARMASREDARHLADWVRAHVGVEAYVEPRTTVTDVTVVLIAHDGAWTRRVVGERGAHRLSRELDIPVYDVRKTGYPQRMRDHDARLRAQRRRARVAELG